MMRVRKHWNSSGKKKPGRRHIRESTLRGFKRGDRRIVRCLHPVYWNTNDSGTSEQAVILPWNRMLLRN